MTNYIRQNTVNDRKLVGGMINSTGIFQQDCASIKYMFSYLDRGLQEISFESGDDFCIITSEGKINVQVKICRLTITFIRKLLQNISLSAENYIIGSGYDDDVRNIQHHKSRHKNNLSGIYYSHDELLDIDWKEYCNSKGIDSERLLHCEFDVIDDINRESIAKSAICIWAENNNIILDTTSLFKELCYIVERKRCECGHLSRNEIIKIVNNNKGTRIISLINQNKSSISDIITELETLIKRNPYAISDLIAIKCSVETEHYMEAESIVFKCINNGMMKNELQGIHLWLLNILNRHSDVLDIVSSDTTYSNLSNIEAAKSLMHMSEHVSAKAYLDKIDKNSWTEETYLLYSVLLSLINKNSEAVALINEYLEINPTSIDGLFILAKLSDPQNAANCYEKILILDSHNADAYMMLAELSEEAFDYNTACSLYIEYTDEKVDKDEIQFSIYAKIIVLGYISGIINIEDWIFKLNHSFRIQRKITGKESLALPVIDKEVIYPFVFISSEDEFQLLLGDKYIYSFSYKTNAAQSAIGLIFPGIDFAMAYFTNQYSENPIKTTNGFSLRESAIPGIYRFYDNYETYDRTIKALIDTKKLMLNHCFEENKLDYYVDDIQINLSIKNGELVGYILIGEIKLNVSIEKIGHGFAEFKKQLRRDCMHNEAAIEFRHTDEYVTRLVFDKKKINLMYI